MSNWLTAKTEPVLLEKRLEEEEAWFQLFLPADLFQFQGHFTEFPLLPGVAQLDWAVRYASDVFDNAAVVSKVSKLKFKQFIKPENTVVLHLRNIQGKGQVLFEMLTGDDVCASGILHMEPK